MTRGTLPAAVLLAALAVLPAQQGHAAPAQQGHPVQQGQARPAAATAAQPALWRVDLARSSLRFTAKQAGAPFEGRFTRWTPQVRFDPRDLAHAYARVEIDVASADTQAADRDGQLRSADWFDPARFPKAVFEARRFAAKGAGFVADGTLTLRGQSRPVRFEFTLAAAPSGERRLQGQAQLSRLAFGVGQGEFESTEWIADAVTVNVTLIAR